MKTQINDELKHKKAFTLIELIIVITILVILATIAFVSFQNYTKDSRDANRLTTINNISKGLDVFQIKTGFYPEPESKTSFTGAGDKKLHQGIISDNITNTINLSEIPLDPKEKTNYIYSTYGDGKYYQIASEAENITSFLYNTTYAENKSSIVKGNYKFDPSLPSLVVIPNSLTGSSIFDPKVCFVTNGGLNSITSNSGTCLKKEEMSLNSFDNSLVGYWDMESLCQNGNCGVGNDGKLKDLSGNENYGSFSGGMVYNNSLTGGMVGKGLNFSGSGHIYLNDPDILKPNFFTLKAIIIPNELGRSQSIFRKRLYGYGLRLGLSGSIITSVSENESGGESNIIDTINNNIKIEIGKTYMINSTYNGTNLKLYINGKLISNKKTLGLNNVYYGSGGIAIGRDGNSPSNTTFNGLIDEVKIYNRALTDQEIAQQARVAGF